MVPDPGRRGVAAPGAARLHHRPVRGDLGEAKRPGDSGGGSLEDELAQGCGAGGDGGDAKIADQGAERGGVE